MIHFKNHKRGFTLIEVVLAMSIAALVLTPILTILSTIIQRVDRSSKAFDYILLCKNLLYEARQKQEPDAQNFSLDKTDVDSGAVLTYSFEKSVDPKSSLASLQGLHKELVTVAWKERDKKRQEQLVTFVYKKPEQKKS